MGSFEKPCTIPATQRIIRTMTSTAAKPASTRLTRSTVATSRSAHALLDEARAAVERAQHDDTEQAYREAAFDCYD